MLNHIFAVPSGGHLRYNIAYIHTVYKHSLCTNMFVPIYLHTNVMYIYIHILTCMYGYAQYICMHTNVKTHQPLKMRYLIAHQMVCSSQNICDSADRHSNRRQEERAGKCFFLMKSCLVHVAHVCVLFVQR